MTADYWFSGRNLCNSLTNGKNQTFKLSRGITIQFEALALIDFHNSHVLRPLGNDNANIQQWNEKT